MLCFCRGKSFAEKTTVLQGDETVKTGGKVAFIGEIFITLQAKTDVMTGMRFVWLLPLVALLMACGGKPTAQELVEVDSLLAVEKNDSAYQIIAAYDPASFENEADRAYYNMLMTHAAVVSYHWPESDSLINEAIRYYKRMGRKESPRLCPAGRQKEYDRLCIFGNSPGICLYGTGGQCRLLYRHADSLSG